MFGFGRRKRMRNQCGHCHHRLHQAMPGEVFPLSMAPVNVPLTIKKVTIDETLQKKLSSLCILPGEKITIIRKNTKQSSVMVMIKEATYALSREICDNVFVS